MEKLQFNLKLSSSPLFAFECQPAFLQIYFL